MSQAKTAVTTNLPATRAVSGRRSLFGGAAAVAIGSVITSGVAAGTAASVGDVVPADIDAALIAACAHFNDLNCQSRARLDVAKTTEEEEEADRFRAHLLGGDNHRDWPALTRVCTTPGSSLAAAVALATTISMFDNGEIIAFQDDPDDYVTRRLVTALMRCLLGSA